MQVLAEQEWRARRAAHRQRVRQWTEPHRRRRREGIPHPVMDFLFTYYSHRPSLLERWQPGLGVALAGGEEFLDRRGYVALPQGVALSPAARTAKRLDTARFVRDLLTAVQDRRPFLGCFGLHEWAMLYRTTPEDVRHASWPLRLGHRGTDEVVESMQIRCSHHDAFRFFTPQARPLNALQPTRADQVAMEQPGCLHNNMDLFKWAYKLDPLVPSELIADCFDLAARIRAVDMRASPYDLRELGYEPIAVETAEGRAEYAARQREFADEAGGLRTRLIEVCAGLLAAETAEAARSELSDSQP
ncbi:MULTISPECIES: 3-methyladenine DNA glycosylase [unclassified Saccharopolyspora]|uniref:3-methyladenine DNA glycosylase n=1 Tax=Saccharopolyspora TaxID=1835 RepID=UPI00190B7D37|nr:3-methyladenine DNA glycosylase [Saccharopolyspora sp. HNM0986]MBK0868046.1 3-methyladenine DNA glycosylase [Saccharopolyspora sp. HNM0986]